MMNERSDSVRFADQFLFDIAQPLGYSGFQHDPADPSPSPPSPRGERVGGNVKRLKIQRNHKRLKPAGNKTGGFFVCANEEAHGY